MEPSSSTPQSDQVDVQNKECTNPGNPNLTMEPSSKMSSSNNEDESKLRNSFNEAAVKRPCELDPQEIDKLFAILFETDSSAFSDILSYEQVTFKPIRRFAPYPVHQHLFMQQQQEQERRRQSLMPSAISRVSTLPRHFRDSLRNQNTRPMYSDVFRSKIVRKIIGFIDGYSSRLLSSASDSSEKCVICMYNYQINQELRKLECNHKFHRKCIDEWLIKSYLCPVCRKDLTGTGKTYKGVAVLYHIWKQEKYPDASLATATVQTFSNCSISHSSRTNVEEQCSNVEHQIKKVKNELSGEASEDCVLSIEADCATTLVDEPREA